MYPLFVIVYEKQAPAAFGEGNDEKRTGEVYLHFADKI
jgi:hypothetical protein